MTFHPFSWDILFVHLQNNKAFPMFIKLYEFFRQNNYVLFIVRVDWNEVTSVASDQAEVLKIYSLKADSIVIFSLPVGLETYFKIYSVTKNNVSGIWISFVKQIMIPDPQ